MNSELLLSFVLFSFVNCLSKYPVLIVISYDGFRYDYIGEKTPYLFSLRKEGTHAKYLNNVFPTKTFPNHHSIATGLFIETHGVVGNTYYNPVKKQLVGYSYDIFHYNEEITPIWIHNQVADEDRYSGVMMWPGSDFPYQNKYPQYVKKYDYSYSWYKRVDDILSWILNPDKPANLIMLYIEDPDAYAHVYGPDSCEVSERLSKLDNLTNYLFEKLEVNNLTKKVNLLFVSDHGMDSVTPSHFIDITQHIEPNTYEMAGISPNLHIIPHECYEDVIYSNLTNFSQKHGHFKVYKKNDLLTRWHYKNNPRTPPIFLLADEGYGFQDLNVTVENYVKRFKINLTDNSQFGIHGYDDANLNMKPHFLAVGPKIKRNHKVDPFNTVDLFGLFCEILEVPQLPTNGSLYYVQDILVHNSHFLQVVPKYLLSEIGIIIFVTAAIFLVIILLYKKKLQLFFKSATKNSSVEEQRLLDEEFA